MGALWHAPPLLGNLAPLVCRAELSQRSSARRLKPPGPGFQPFVSLVLPVLTVILVVSISIRTMSTNLAWVLISR